MIQRINPRRDGFTLVEIIVVMAIVGFLACIAVPNLMRSRSRTQAAQCKQDFRMIDAANDQWASENNKIKGSQAAWSDLRKFMKENSRLGMSATCTDSLGNTVSIPTVGSPVAVPLATWSALSDVAGSDFWSPYVSGS